MLNRHSFSSKILIQIVFISILFATVFSSCQKELDDAGIVRFCGLSKLTIAAGTTANIIEEITYEYDSLLQRPNLIRYQNTPAGISRNYFPAYSGDTISFGSLGAIILDGGRRVTSFINADPLPGSDEGEYLYTYNGSGQMTARVYDDRVTELERTTYGFTGDALSSFSLTALNIDSLVTGRLTYASAPRLHPSNLQVYGELFPELLPFMPLLRIGRVNNYTPEKLDGAYNIPGNPVVNYSVTYSNYSFNPEGLLASFQSNLNIPGTPAVTVFYALEYKCY